MKITEYGDHVKVLAELPDLRRDVQLLAAATKLTMNVEDPRETATRR